MNKKILFIIGVGRSGTSLLQSMFAAHPNVGFLPESAFLRRYVYRGNLHSAYGLGGKKAVIKILEQDEKFARTGLNNLWIGDKDPRLVEFLPLVKTLFPDAHVIQVIRDPRDVLVSKKKAAWSKDKLTVCSWLWGVAMERNCLEKLIMKSSTRI